MIEYQTPGVRSIDEGAIEAVTLLPLGQVVHELVGAVGIQTTAYIGNVDHTRHVRAWETGAATPRAPRDLALRSALQAVRLLSMSDGAGVAKTWLFGTSPSLGYEAPAYVLRNAKEPNEFTTVVRAARAVAQR
jgi:hypothetical protein